jgi:hypothetical protein
MGLIAAVLIPIVLFFWFAACFTLWAWLQTIFCLCQLQFVRATIWFSLGSGMLFWWFDKDIDFDTWLRGSAVIVGLGTLGTFVRWRKKQQAKLSIPTMPTWTPANDNQLPMFSLHVKNEG